MSWEKLTQDITFYAFFVASKQGKTGITVTVDVWEHTRAGVATEIVNGGSATEIGDGLYKYVLSAASVDAIGEYVAVFKTADSSVDQQHIPALWIVGRSGIENLDAAVSSRNATTPPTTAAIADALLDDEEVSAGVTVREALAAAGSAGDPLTNPVGGYVAPQAGYYLQRLANDQVELVSVFDPVTLGLSYLYGDDYAVEEDRQQDFTTELDLTGAAVTWRVKAASSVVQVVCTVVDASTYRLEPTAVDLAAIGVGRWAYDLEITLANGHVVTEVAGTVTVRQDVR